jgi:hypothetical protein
MELVRQSKTRNSVLSAGSGFSLDTTFVLFFLSVEFGRTLGDFGLDLIFLAITLVLVAVLPYFLSSEEKPDFGIWILGRGAITLFAVGMGWMFKQSLGVALPETLRFLPMTLLIMSAMLCCYIQFYSFLKLRFIK